MLEVTVGVEVEADQNRDDLRIGHYALSAAFRYGGEDGSTFFAISTSNSLQKSSAIQKISVTLLSVIMIQYLLVAAFKLLHISDITKRIGNFFKLPIQLSWGVAYPELALSEIIIDNVIYALDSTTISTSIKLAAWALGKYSKGAVKMHTLLDLRGSIPANIHITDGKWHDSNELDNLTPEPFAFYVMDKAYVDFKALFRFHQSQAFWVSRPKENMKFTTVKQMGMPDETLGIVEDSLIRVTGYKSRKLYPVDMRFVRVYDPENDTIVDFISNNLEVSALEISNLCRHRWDIEVFFKWIKQNIVVKTLWGFSENAVKIHLWTAVSAYLTVARIKADYKSCYSITEAATLIRISALERVDLRQLLTKQDLSTNSNQNVKELSLFDDF